MSSVFHGVLSKPLFKYFGDFCRENITEEEKALTYSAFVSEIYSSSLPLSELVAKYLFEDENIYIKTRAAGKRPSKEIIKAKNHELSVFSEFISLTEESFRSEMGVAYASPFKTTKIDLSARYERHVREVDKRGFGIFSAVGMFRLDDSGEIEPIISADKTSIRDFVGYKEERDAVIKNTLAFIEGKPALNTLLSGDAGTGKSSTVKAVANHFFDRGIRLIELRKDQLRYLPLVMGKVSENPLKFIIFIDDLAFNKSDDNFSMLKAALEGSASAKADNAIIYATSNRRHIIKESFGERDGDDVHRNDTLQETLSLSERFGLIVHFSKPGKALYLDIVHELAERASLDIPREKLDILAEAFALRRGSRSARCAEQFIDSLV